MSDELKQLIEDAAKLLGIDCEVEQFSNGRVFATNKYNEIVLDPLDPDRRDLWKVADAAGLGINFKQQFVMFEDDNSPTGITYYGFEGDYQSLALAILRAASAGLNAKEGQRAP